MFVEKLDLAWDTIHVVDADFAHVLQTLHARFTVGSKKGAGHDAEEEEEAQPAPTHGHARGLAARRTKWPPSGPPAKKGRSSKKRQEAEVVVPVQRFVRFLPHIRSEQRVERALAEAVAAMQEDEASATAVHPPFVVAQAKPFPAWPHGWAAIYVQFPFLLDQSWWSQGKWTVRRRKAVVQAVGERYLMFFTPKRTVQPGSVRGPNATEPLLPLIPPAVGPVGVTPLPEEPVAPALVAGNPALSFNGSAAAAVAGCAAATTKVAGRDAAEDEAAGGVVAEAEAADGTVAEEEAAGGTGAESEVVAVLTPR